MKRVMTDSLIAGLALFAMFFGAGNIIFPPYTGLLAGDQWLWSFICYHVADIGLALITIYAMLRAGSIDRPAGILERLGHYPARLMMIATILCIGPFLAIPRTCATVYEIGFMPWLGQDYMLWFSIAYFAICGLCSIKELALISLMGKYLIPLCVLGLLAMIVKGIISPLGTISERTLDAGLIWSSISAGYQTMDVLAAMIFGFIIINALMARGHIHEPRKSFAMLLSSLVAGALLFVIYGGLCYLGATVSGIYPKDIALAQLVVQITVRLFGQHGVIVLAVIVTLACLTTAIGLTGAAASYFSRICRVPYAAWVLIISAFSMVVANVGLDALVRIAAPVLGVIYPCVLVVVILSLFRIKNDRVFKLATLGAFLSSLLAAFADFIPWAQKLPLYDVGLYWLLPATLLAVAGFFPFCKKGSRPPKNF